MRKNKFLKILNNKLENIDENYKKKVLEKYEKKINIKLNVMKEDEAVQLFDIDNIVKTEYFYYKFRIFFQKFINKVIFLLKKFYYKIFHLVCAVKSKFFHYKKDTRKKIKKASKKTICENSLPFVSNSILRCMYMIFSSLLLVFLFLLGLLFFINLFALLDGVKLFSFFLTIIVVTLLVILLLLFMYNNFNRIKFHKKHFFIILIILLILFGFSVGYNIYDVYKLEEVDNLNNYYSISNEINIFDLIDGDVLDIQFNPYYDNVYDVIYDDSLNNQVKIVTNYYRNYYDFLITKNRDDVYISFHANKRNLVSTLIEGLKDNKIFNFNELKRYDIVIYINENDKNKISIH